MADLTFRQGITFGVTWEYRDPSTNAPIPLTGYYARLSTPTLDLRSTDAPTSARSLTLDAAAGTITLTLGATQTAVMETELYEVEAHSTTDPDDVLFIDAGKFKVQPQVRP